MIAMRLVLVIAVTLAAMQSASADEKKEPKKTIDVQSYSWGATNSGSIGSTTGGGSSSQVHVRKRGENPIDYMKMNNASVSSAQKSSTSGGSGTGNSGMKR